MVSGDRTLQGRERERLIQMAAQLEAANAAGVDIHEHVQIDELTLEAHVGDVGDPDGIGLFDRQIGHQIGIAWIGVITVCRAATALGRTTRQPQFAMSRRTRLPLTAPHLRGAVGQ